MEDLIARFGLLGVYLGAAVEGDVILVLGGVTAHLGLLSLPWTIAAAAIGCFTGDVAWYLAGRWRSNAIRRSRAYRTIGPSVERAAARVGPWQILLSRVVYGTRIATMVFWGLHRLPFARFALVDSIGCVLWAGMLGMLGYGASSGAMAILGRVRRAEFWLLGAAAVSLAALVAARTLYGRTGRSI